MEDSSEPVKLPTIPKDVILLSIGNLELAKRQQVNCFDIGSADSYNRSSDWKTSASSTLPAYRMVSMRTN